MVEYPPEKRYNMMLGSTSSIRKERQIMQKKAELFFESIQNKKVTFIGMGVSHLDCIKLFVKKGIQA